jgi:hypothetical protein
MRHSIIGLTVAVSAICVLAGAPRHASAAVVDVNGICINANPCTAGTALTFGTSQTLPFSGDFSVNGDPFDISGTLATSSGGPGLSLSFAVNFLVTYLGKVPIAGGDTVTVDASELYDQPFGGGTLNLVTGMGGEFSSGVGASSSVKLVNTVDGTTQQTGPFSAPGSFSGTEYFTAPNADPISDDFTFTLNFAEGTKAGSQIAVNQPLTAVPEPATWAMMLVGFFGMGGMVRGSRNKRAIAA